MQDPVIYLPGGDGGDIFTSYRYGGGASRPIKTC